MTHKKNIIRAEDHLGLKEVLKQITAQRGSDFSMYRESTLIRRVEKRLRVKKIAVWKDYTLLLGRDEKEMDALLDELTINVTNFFRDMRIFKFIEKQVLPELFETKDGHSRKTLRIWSCGSAAGQEPTSILILILEYLKQEFGNCSVRVYGTDFDRLSIRNAQLGIYDDNEFRECPDNLRQKYFTDLDQKRYQRKKGLSANLVFKQHDIIRDEPLKNMDIILCRNVFIYFKPELQNICLAKFWNALKEQGFLVLGLTEILRDTGRKLFASYSNENRIYRKLS